MKYPQELLLMKVAFTAIVVMVLSAVAARFVSDDTAPMWQQVTLSVMYFTAMAVAVGSFLFFVWSV